MYAIGQLTGTGWTYNSSNGQGYNEFPAILSPTATLSFQLEGFPASTLYYSISVAVPAFYSGVAGTWASSASTYPNGNAVENPAWSVGEGQVTRNITISLPAGGLTGGQINGTLINTTLTATGLQAVAGRLWAFQSTQLGAPYFNVTASTNPNDGGQTPPDPIKLNLTPSGTAVVLQGTQQILNASAVSDSGVFFGNTSFDLQVITPGLGTFAENGGTSITKGNPPNSPAISPTPFNISPSFVGLGQIRCENGYASNSPQFWTFDVKTPVVASGGGFLSLLQVESG
jgi:hypothetical protein